jgi:DNA-3-methyladenine glycosylase
MDCLTDAFFKAETTMVARRLLGCRLVRILNGERISGIINETEAYIGESDLACHAHSGKTRRNEVMYGPPGRAYIYFTYGMHWCLNVVTGGTGFPAAVLLRGIFPVEGLNTIASHRQGRKPEDWVNGPAKICKALAIDGALNGISLFEDHSPLFIEEDVQIPEKRISFSSRIGIEKTPEPWRSKPWRFFINDQENFLA